MKINEVLDMSDTTNAILLAEEANINVSDAALVVEAQHQTFTEVKDVDAYIAALLRGEVPAHGS
jgi:hypothetical protein